MSKSNKNKSGGSKSKTGSKTKSVHQKFKKLEDQRAHALLRPSMYIGSPEPEEAKMWIYNEKRNDFDPEFIYKKIEYVPGLYKIFDEILVNARDHEIRCLAEKMDPCTMIKVNIDPEMGRITVWNNGAGIPVVEHEEHKILIPSMIFGELLSSSNYNDDEERKWGGTNGLGAKLTNIFSTEFEVETLDAENNKKFYQKFTDNLSKKGKAKVTSGGGKKSYTKISFVPDFSKFHIKGLTKDMVALFKKRVYDIAMTSDAKVYYNNSMIKANNFTKYVDLYFPTESEHKKVLDISDENWKICVVYDPTDKMEHQNISFVNGICTSNGGTHLKYVSDQVVKKIIATINKKKDGKKLALKSSLIKENLIFFVDSVIVNPAFETQTKEKLITKVAKFGSSYKAPEKFLNAITKTGVVDQIIANAQAKAEARMGKGGTSGKSLLGFAKLYDAHRAKRKKGDCTLILTEGDSAKTFAMSGFNKTGRDYYGVFPLRGKLLNVRNASSTEILKNEEIQAIMKIMGLVPKKEYDSLNGLRYGSIMILTDSDLDGYHIKGLIMNFVHHFWPSLIKYDGFVRCLATPLLKVTKGKGKTIQSREFISMQEFEDWKKENNGGKGWSKPKYYKGLGTSSSKEAQECFTDLDEKMIHYYWETKLKEDLDKKIKSKKSKKADKKKSDKITSSEFIDEESDLVSEIYKPKYKDPCEDAITLAFAKKREDDRKMWLNTYDPNAYIDNTEKKISIYDFIHRELLAFSVYDNIRSLPNLMDGFKPGQRKVYYGCSKKNIYKSEIKVAQLSGYIAEHTCYHHGEQSLNETIIKMAQNYVGSNNINLLVPKGQFGSRLCGGKDAASARYIFTQLDKLGKKIFIKDDFDILNGQIEEGHVIEPIFYAPIIPMILVNGAEGIGTGYSSNVEPCNPRDVVANLRRIIAGEKPKSMKPWYRHFTGTIEKIEPGKYVSRAKYDLVDDNTIHITDLPIGTWTDNYKAFLAKLIITGATDEKKLAASKKTATRSRKGAAGKKKSSYLAKKSAKSATARVSKKNKIGADIETYTEDCTDIKVSITIVFKKGKLKQHIKNGTLESGLKLKTKIHLTNMHLFDEEGKIRKYDSYGAILKNFAKVRLDLYQKRKDYLLGKWKKEMDMLKWKLKFIEGVISEEIIVFKKETDETIAQLEERGFPKFSNTETNDEGSYNYLLDISIRKFNKNEVKKLKKEIADKKEEIATLENKTPSDLWTEELDAFMEEYEKWEDECDKEYYDLMSDGKTKSKSKSKKTKSVEV